MSQRVLGAGALLVLLATGAAARAEVLTVANPASITIPASGAGSPYPSPVVVTAFGGSVARVTVTLVDFSHTYPSDVDVLLVGPTGQTVMLMSDVGGSSSVDAIDLTFDDLGAAMSGGALASGTYRPTNFGSFDPFPAPAPAGRIV